MLNLNKKCFDLKKEVLETCVSSGKGHVTSALSCMNIMVALYQGKVLNYKVDDPKWEGRDRFVLSKGQASPGLYTVLADVGFYSKEELKKFAKLGGMFSVHLQNSVPGVEVTAGSLGQAYGLGAGMALGLKRSGKLQMVYALLGDGECYEGSIWETAMFASHNDLNNLVTIIDRNYQCVMDFTENLLALEPLDEKWKAFGFNVIKIEDDVNKLVKTLKHLKTRPSKHPTVIIVDTLKGSGIEMLCYDPKWHGTAPPQDLLEECIAQLTEGANENE